ncbi:MAG: hypothetical protein ACK53Y_28075, partial [bacterium]
MVLNTKFTALLGSLPGNVRRLAQQSFCGPVGHPLGNLHYEHVCSQLGDKLLHSDGVLFSLTVTGNSPMINSPSECCCNHFAIG